LLFKLLSQDHGAGLIVGTIPAFIFFSTGLLAALISAYYVYQIGVRIESSHGTFHFALLALGLPIVINWTCDVCSLYRRRSGMLGK
jgi:hypothetical protein